MFWGAGHKVGARYVPQITDKKQKPHSKFKKGEAAFWGSPVAPPPPPSPPLSPQRADGTLPVLANRLHLAGRVLCSWLKFC